MSGDKFQIGDSVNVRSGAYIGTIIDKGIRGEFRGQWLIRAPNGLREWVPESMLGKEALK